MRTKMSRCVFEALSQMIEKRSLVLFVVIICAQFIENAEIACLSQICSHSGYEPQRVIVEAASDRTVAAFCQRLILMVCASVGELGVGYIYDPFSCACRDEVYKTEKVLT